MPPWLDTGLQVLQPVTPIGLVLAAVLLVLSGRIVPRRVVQDIRADRDARVKEAREQTAIWRQAYQTSEEARMRQHDLLRDALEGVHTITHLLESRRDAPPSSAALPPAAAAHQRLTSGGEPSVS